LPIENNELLAKDGVLCHQVFAAASDIRYGVGNEDGRFWFGEILAGFFDMIEVGSASLDDSRKHDELNAILVG
jgi:hypothetical protein